VRPVEDDEPRLFVAVPLPDEARDAVIAIVDTVREAVDREARLPRSAVRWVRMEHLHLTLRFLGPTPEQQVAVVARCVDRGVTGLAPAEIVITGSGAFPSPSRPRTIWMGIQDGAGALAAIARRLDDELEPEGWPRETRPFRAHLTLARADGRREGPLVARHLASALAAMEIRFSADRAVLFESITGHGRAEYRALHEVPLLG
jgi:2'-5' RNA ligase